MSASSFERIEEANALRVAAAIELESSRMGLHGLSQELLDKFSVFRNGEFSDDDNHRSLALCFLANMVESGDA